MRVLLVAIFAVVAFSSLSQENERLRKTNQALLKALGELSTESSVADSLCTCSTDNRFSGWAAGGEACQFGSHCAPRARCQFGGNPCVFEADERAVGGACDHITELNKDYECTPYYSKIKRCPICLGDGAGAVDNSAINSGVLNNVEPFETRVGEASRNNFMNTIINNRSAQLCMSSRDCEDWYICHVLTTSERQEVAEMLSDMGYDSTTPIDMIYSGMVFSNEIEGVCIIDSRDVNDPNRTNWGVVQEDETRPDRR